MRPVRIFQEQNDMHRSDYEQIVAKSLGFTCSPDGNRGAGWCSFQNGDIRVWSARNWVRAHVIDDQYRKHQMHRTLTEALKDENGVAFGPESDPRRYSNCISFPWDQTRSKERFKHLAMTCTKDEFRLICLAEGYFSNGGNGTDLWYDKLRAQE